MIFYLKGDLFKSGCEALVNPVNCVGVMGAGLAWKFKRMFPANFEAYKKACQQGKLKLGEVLVFGSRPIIINFPTKGHWSDQSKLTDVALGLHSLVREVERNKIKSVAVPALGCGLGGLEWKRVRPLMDELLSDGVEWKVFLPLGGV